MFLSSSLFFANHWLLINHHLSPYQVPWESHKLNLKKKPNKQNFKPGIKKHEIFILDLPHWKCIEVSWSWISVGRRGKLGSKKWEQEQNTLSQDLTTRGREMRQWTARGRIWHEKGDKWWRKVPEENDRYIYGK